MLHHKMTENFVFSHFFMQENPRFERGFRKAYSYESIRQTLCYNGRGLPTATKAREEKTNGQE